jgi:hypothetical protein
MADAAEMGKAVSKSEATGVGQQATGRKALPVGLSSVACSLTLALLNSPSALAATYSVIVSGLGGEPAYEQRFREQNATLAESAQKLSGDPTKTIALSGAAADRESVRKELRGLAGKLTPDDEIIVTLIGHGSFDGEEYRFNLPGADITATELGTLFDQLRAGKQLIVNATSASGAVADKWKRDNRIVITATKSGGERTATRFSEHWVKALSSAEADLNKDDIVTAAEAFDFASRKVADSFKASVSMATEHARLEGQNPSRFQVARFGTAARLTTDAQMNELFAQRVRIERDLDEVKERKSALATDAYYDELEAVLVRLAQLQRQIDAKQGAASAQDGAHE